MAGLVLPCGLEDLNNKFPEVIIYLPELKNVKRLIWNWNTLTEICKNEDAYRTLQIISHKSPREQTHREGIEDLIQTDGDN